MKQSSPTVVSKNGQLNATTKSFKKEESADVKYQFITSKDVLFSFSFN